MQDFKNAVCPYCGKRFAAGDDIVVCPECGTPHHRECYKQNGKCANEEKHGSFEWGEEKQEKKQEPPKAEGTVACKSCGTMNPEGGNYCLSCGAPLAGEPNPGKSADPFAEFQKEREKAFESAMGETEFDGVSIREGAAFVGNSSEYFLPRFRLFMLGRRTDVNFSAFILSYFYLFYRKMYGLGAAVFAATTVLGIPGFLLNLATIQDEYVRMGLLSQVIWTVPHQETLMVYASIASVLVWAIRLMLMLFFNRAYMNKMITSVKKVKAEYMETGTGDETQLYPKIRAAGGTSMLIPIVLIVLTFVLSMGIVAWIMTSPFFVAGNITF